MNETIFETPQNLEDLLFLSPTGDGGYGHAYIGLKSNIAGADELAEDGLYSDAERLSFIDDAVNGFIRKFGESLKNEGAMDKFDPAIRAAILERLGQNPE